MNFTQTASVVLFRIIFPTLIVLVQYLLYRRARRWSRDAYPSVHWLPRTILWVFVVFNLPMLLLLLVRPTFSSFPPWFLYLGVYPYMLWHTTTFFIGLLLLVGAIITLPIRIPLWIARRIPQARMKLDHIGSTNTYRTFDASRRLFLRRGMYGVTAVAVSGTAYGMILGRHDYEITSSEFTIPNLPPELDKFSIAFVSDIHSSLFMEKEQMTEYVRVINSLKADMVVVGGDFVNNQTAEVYPFAEAFSNLKAPFGIYGVMGNHDFYAEDPDLVAKEVDNCGVRLLRNDKIVIEKNGGKFYLIGVDDPGRNSRTPIKLDEAIGSAPPSAAKILMCHRPYYLSEAAEKQIDLVLSGHTHGGQIVFGRFGNTVIAPSSLASSYVWGRYSIGTTHMYVSRGIGTVGPPIRINCPPEITKIVLKCHES